MKIKSRYKWLFAIAALLIIVGFIAYRLEFRQLLVLKVQKELLRAINQDPSRLYDISCSTADFNLTTGNIFIHNVQVQPRQEILDSLENANEVVRMLIELQVEKIALLNLNIRKLLMEEHISLDNFEIRSPELKIVLNPSSKDAEDKSIIQEILIPEFKVSLQNFDIINASGQIDNLAFQDSFFLALDSFNLHVDNIDIDSSSFIGPIEKNFDNLFVEARNLRSPTFDIYRLEANKMTFDLAMNQFRIEGINLNSNMDKHEYGKKNGVESDWFKGSIEFIEMLDFDLRKWHETGKICYRKLTISQPDIYVFRDKRLTDPPSKTTYLPAYALRNIPLTFLIDTIEILSGKVNYDEHHMGYSEASKMEINKVFGTGYRLTNDSLYWANTGSFEMDLEAYLWNDGKLKSKVVMPLHASKDEINISGKISDLNFKSMNSFFEHTLYTRFENGKLNSLEFTITAREDVAHGKLDMNYQDLKIEVLGLPNAQDKSHKKKNKFYSFLANTVVPKYHHPQSRHYKQGIIEATRPTDKSIFKYMAVCIQDGIMSCIIPHSDRKKRKAKKK